LDDAEYPFAIYFPIIRPTHSQGNPRVFAAQQASGESIVRDSFVSMIRRLSCGHDKRPAVLRDSISFVEIKKICYQDSAEQVQMYS